MSAILKLLIIEDDANMSVLVARALDGLADEVDRVDNWQQAFIHVETEKDDVVWADLRMPDSPEYESIGNIAKLRALNRRVVIIVGSGFITPLIRAQLDRAGIDGVFYKSAEFRAEQVASLIVLGMMRARLRNTEFDNRMLTKALEWLSERYPTVAIP
jgi:DNA-binding NtrC family response regulator